MKRRHIFFIALLFTTFGFSWPFDWLFSHPNPEKFGTIAWLNKEYTILKSQNDNINENVLRLSLLAYINAKKTGISDDKQILTVIDYSKPSTEKRLWIFDIKNGRTLFNTWVSHGRNSGGIRSTSFSNTNGSLKSSIGVFETEHPYFGGDGYSLRLRGLEQGVNDNAYHRNIVVHGASYVNPDTIRKYGQIGRSWGCPAVSSEISKPIINTIKDQTVLFAYYPDRHWLNHSRYLIS